MWRQVRGWEILHQGGERCSCVCSMRGKEVESINDALSGLTLRIWIMQEHSFDLRIFGNSFLHLADIRLTHGDDITGSD